MENVILIKYSELIKEATGIEISGILGTDFFSEQKCIIDFNEYTVY